MAPSHYLNQYWNIVNWILRNKLQWNVNCDSNIFIQENTLENVWKMAVILSLPQYKWPGYSLRRKQHDADTIIRYTCCSCRQICEKDVFLSLKQDEVTTYKLQGGLLGVLTSRNTYWVCYYHHKCVAGWVFGINSLALGEVVAISNTV